MSIDDLKKAAAAKAVEQIQNGMVLGLGTGSTTRHAIEKIGELWQSGALTDILGIPTSEQTATQARGYGIPLGSLNEYPTIDLTIDGADDVDPELSLIKGLGGALLREKMIAQASKLYIVIVDEGKLVNRLGDHSPLPVEVTQFGWKAHAYWLEALGCQPRLRGGEVAPYITDNGNYIVDCTFPNGIEAPAELASTLRQRAGVIEHGLFLNMADKVIVAKNDGLLVREKA